MYLAIGVLAIPALHTLRIEGVLLTSLMLIGVHIALRLMFAAGPKREVTGQVPELS